MTNGAFGAIHEKLLVALADRVVAARLGGAAPG
jgi:hypothetical protein